MTFDDADPLTQAHITGQERLRAMAAVGVTAAWGALETYDEPDTDTFISRAVPVVMVAQRASAALTRAFVARHLGRRPVPVNVNDVIGGAVRGVAPQEVYRRPFITVWSALKNGTPYEDAVAAGLARAASTAEMDVQLTSRATFGAVAGADARIVGYKRVTDGNACKYCLALAGVFVKSADAMALHNFCGCTLEPITDRSEARGRPGRQFRRDPHRLSSPVPESVAIHQHGELGTVLGDPNHGFTTEAQTH